MKYTAYELHSLWNSQPLKFTDFEMSCLWNVLPVKHVLPMKCLSMKCQNNETLPEYVVTLCWGQGEGLTLGSDPTNIHSRVTSLKSKQGSLNPISKPVLTVYH